MTQHYFSESPVGDARKREIEVELAGAPRRLVTAGGVFSPEHLDQGTAVLLRTLDKMTPEAEAVTGPILDLGCGWGPIALSAGLNHPGAEIWAVDINERARALTTENATRLGLTHLRVVSPDDVPFGLEFSEIRSNPPIRIGKQALHALLGQWLPRLAPGGLATLVVAKHLGADSLQSWIAAEFPTLSVTRIARDKGFSVIQAVRR
ncbi:class I SAM-dependent methyltransferase [Leucobacter sp. W1153]|uniref:class I SAM-dependent methyltransferase n=1 Tax=Leucobacter sp. W1153 TaxID=3439064 RepID=UPI003F2AF2DE